jgi:hypothetical protein
LRHYWFKWLGRFFYETQTVFGNTAAPAQFDDLGEIISLISRTLTKIPKSWILRQLDDTIVVSPQSSGYTGKFVTAF